MRPPGRPAAPLVLLGPDERERARDVPPGLGVVQAERTVFPDGEQLVSVPDPAVLTGRQVLVVQSTPPPQDSRLVTLLQLVHLARAARPAGLSCFVPYLGYQRQDRRVEPGQALSAELVLETLAALGVANVVTVDKHSARPGPRPGLPRVLDLSGAAAFSAFSRERGLRPDLVLSPDLGGLGRAESLAARLGVPSLAAHKSKNAELGTWYETLPDVPRGSNVVIIDDLCSSGSTLRPLCLLLQEQDVRVHLFVTHLLLGPEALRRRLPPLMTLAHTDSCGDHTAPIRVLPQAVDAWLTELVPAAPRSAPTTSREMRPS